MTPSLTAAGPASLDEALAFRAAEAPGDLAFAEGAERLTWGELRAEAEALAGGLASLGVGRQERVALFLPAGLGFIRAFFALQRLAAVPCAFAPGGPAPAAARRAARVRPCLVLVAGPEGAELAAALTAAGLRAADLATVPRSAPPPEPDASGGDVAFCNPRPGPRASRGPR